MDQPIIEGENYPVEQSIGAVAVASRQQAEIQSAITIAKRFPRDEAGAYAKAMRAFESPPLAEEALYKLEFGRTPVQGPSVHSARVLARCWGNIKYGCDTIHADDHASHLRGYAHDMENNICPTQEAYVRKLVPRKNRQTGATEYVRPSELEWQRELNKQAAILERNCLLKLLPRDMVEECMAVARRTLEKVAEGGLKTSREQFTRKLAMSFDEIGVSSKMLERYLGHGLALLDKKEVADLQGIYKAIKDGQAKREDFFSFTDLGGADSGPPENN
jgi:hypothetical protein